jgi:hypothetical protein
MATVTRDIPDALDAKIKDNTVGWSTQAAWWQWVKDETRRELTNRQLRVVEAEQAAALEAARAVVLNDTSLDG